MQMRSFRNSAIAAVAVSVVSTATSLWSTSVTGQRDDELGARGRDLARLQRFTISCSRATRLAAECASGAGRTPEVMVEAVEECAADWESFQSRVSPEFSAQLGPLRSATAPLLRSVNEVVGQCIDGFARSETATTLSFADERFENAVSATIGAAEERVREARTRWDAAHRRVRTIAVGTGLWALGIALAMMLSVRRIRQTSVALDSEKSRASELDAFASRAAHDLRGLLTPLPFIASSLVRAQGDNERLEALARRLEGTSKRAARMIDALLAFARIGHAQAPGASDVATVVDDLLGDLSPLVTTVNAEVRREHLEGRVRMDAALLYAVVMNLVSNSLKFMRSCPVRIVTVRASRSGDEVELVVEDTGPGIKRDDLQRVFEPFYRSQPGTTPGSGLGLATVSKIVRAHGGEVWLSSELGQGTRAHVRLPCADAPVRPLPVQDERERSDRDAENESQPLTH